MEHSDSKLIKVSQGRKSREPGKRCVVMFCDKTNADGVSLHQFPADENVRRQWISFVRVKRDPKTWTPGSGHICSDHFTPENYQGLGAKLAGFSSKLLLKKDAVPSKQVAPTPEQLDAARRVKRKLPLSDERSELGAKNEYTKTPKRPSRALSKLTANRLVTEFERVQEEHLGENELGDASEPSDEQGVQAPKLPSTKVNKGTQLSHRRPICRSKGMQVSPKIKVLVDCGVQCNFANLPPLTLLSTTKDNSLDENENLTEYLPPEWPFEETEVDDEDYNPSVDSEDDDESNEDNIESVKSLGESTAVQPHEERKFIVFESSLLRLFASCPICAGPAEATVVKIVGTMVKIEQKCKEENCEFFQVWCSQPIVGRQMAVGNLLLSASILLSGSSAAKSLRMLRIMNVACICESTYYRHTSSYVNPIIIKKWKDHQGELLTTLCDKEGGLVLAGDGRCDSPGYCAKFGSFTLIEQRVNRVVDFQLVQSNEVRNSAWMEHEGLLRAVHVISEARLNIDQLITDRHKQNTAWIRRNLPDTAHYFDIWHVAKGLCKKVDKLAKKKDYADVGEWRQSISNHMYWCAASTPDGDGQLMQEKWKILPLHIQNIHVNNESETYPDCGHGELEGDSQNRLWLDPGSYAAVKLEELLLKPQVLKDISQLSPKYQTSTLEAKHSLDIQFVPKHTAFSYWGMYTRLCLSALHYNENADRMQAVTIDGRPRYCIRFPKSKHGEHSVREIKEKATYGYCSDAVGQLFKGYQDNPSALKQYIAGLQVNAPPPLASSFQRPDREEAITHFVSRYVRSTLVN